MKIFLNDVASTHGYKAYNYYVLRYRQQPSLNKLYLTNDIYKALS